MISYLVLLSPSLSCHSLASLECRCSQGPTCYYSLFWSSQLMFDSRPSQNRHPYQNVYFAHLLHHQHQLGHPLPCHPCKQRAIWINKEWNKVHITGEQLHSFIVLIRQSYILVKSKLVNILPASCFLNCSFKYKEFQLWYSNLHGELKLRIVSNFF